MTWFSVVVREAKLHVHHKLDDPLPIFVNCPNRLLQIILCDVMIGSLDLNCWRVLFNLWFIRSQSCLLIYFLMQKFILKLKK